MNTHARMVSGLIAAVGFFGCGGGSGGGATFSTGVPSGTEVQSLTPAQANQLCDDINSYFTKLVDSPSLCQYAAVSAVANEAMQDTTLTDAQLQALCTSTTTAVCALLTVDAGATGTPDGGTTSCGPAAGCTATVGQLTACLNATGSSFTTFENMFPNCSMVTRAKLASLKLDAAPNEPSACTVLDTTCPNFNPMPNLGGLATN
jgi:hypothetical protein